MTAIGKYTETSLKHKSSVNFFFGLGRFERWLTMRSVGVDSFLPNIISKGLIQRFVRKLENSVLSI